jgi:hypothetical protein
VPTAKISSPTAATALSFGQSKTPYIIKEIWPGFFPCLIVSTFDTFLFQAAEKRLHRRIVIAIASSAHAGLQPMVPTEPLPVVAAVLRALIEGSTMTACFGFLFQTAINRASSTRSRARLAFIS